MSKDDVKTVQRHLQGKGFYKGAIDGDFGAGTRRAYFEMVNEPEPLSERLPEPPASAIRISAMLVMANQNATRNRPITPYLQHALIDAVTEVYGRAARIVVYSGGQDRKGRGTRRTGSIRHDDYGEGGRAADCYIHLDGTKLTGTALARLGQYWLAKRLGGCGLEMATGGIHLDEWTKPPSGGGMFWTYAYSNGKPWGRNVRAMLEAGHAGKLPKLYKGD